MKVSTWIDENRAFLEEAMSVLGRYAPVPASVELLFRYRGLAPQSRMDPVVEVVDEEDVVVDSGHKATHAYVEKSVRPGYLVLRTAPKPVAPAPAPQIPVEAMVPSSGMAWNKIVKKNLQEQAQEKHEEEEVVEMVEVVWTPTQDQRNDAFDTETHNNEWLLGVLTDVRDVAHRHNCCYGVHSVAFQYALGELVGA
jgi:hypothetical protein